MLNICIVIYISMDIDRQIDRQINRYLCDYDYYLKNYTDLMCIYLYGTMQAVIIIYYISFPHSKHYI